jgi:hypothetical protein
MVLYNKGMESGGKFLPFHQELGDLRPFLFLPGRRTQEVNGQAFWEARKKNQRFVLIRWIRLLDCEEVVYLVFVRELGRR